MQTQCVAQQQFFEDLSTILEIFKAKASELTKRYVFEEQVIKSENEKIQQIHRNQKMQQLIEKYKLFQTQEKGFFIIMKRFLARVSEILRNLNRSIKKNKLPLMLLYKQIELEIAKQLKSENIGKIIIYILKCIPAQIKTFGKQHQLNIHLVTISNNDKITPNNLNFTQKIQENNHEKLADILQKNINKFACMGIDTQSLRGMFFDLREDNASQQASSNFYREALSRNRLVRNQMSFYEKEYKEYQKRLQQELQSPRKKKIKRTINMNSEKYTMTVSKFINFQSNRDVSELKKLRQTKRQKYNRIKSAASKVSKTTSQTISYIHTTEANQQKLYQSIFHEKEEERKKRSIKMNNVAFGFTPTLSGRMTTTREEVLQRRKEFYKKTQDHLKMRYHHANRKQLWLPSKLKNNATHRLAYETIVK